jgi:hypothetical protein
MAEMKILKPSREGLIVRDPRTLKALAMGGEQKSMSAYWWRRLRDGSIVVVDPPIEKPARARRKPDANADEEGSDR